MGEGNANITYVLGHLHLALFRRTIHRRSSAILL
jgi:hypothetical protein